jgi:predicted dehydrogenase
MEAGMKVWIVGAGGMSADYVRVTDALKLDSRIIGRGEAAAALLEQRLGRSVARGGLQSALAQFGAPEVAIIAVGVEVLAEVTSQALRGGVKRVLVEKPAGLDRSEVLALAELSMRHSAHVSVAYNRRFFASVLAARALIEEDGGVDSFSFEFTEWSHEIEKLRKAPGVKENWVLANSSHVLDLAFHLGGAPMEMHSFTRGRLDWHPAGAVFAGAGRARGGALFSYQANWRSAGRWGLEINTTRRRLIFRPMEQLQVMMKGSVSIHPVEVAGAELDAQFKPGLYRQVEAFVHGSGQSSLCSLEEHVTLTAWYERIAGYPGVENGGHS